MSIVFFNDCTKNELNMRSCSWTVTDSNISIFDLINRGPLFLGQSKRMSYAIAWPPFRLTNVKADINLNLFSVT